MSEPRRLAVSASLSPRGSDRLLVPSSLRREPRRVALKILTTAAALVSVQVVSNRDAISYHYDIILYLSHLGVPPGLSLVHERLGYVSSWFAIPAVFNHGFLTGRTSTLGNGFALLLAAGHLQHLRQGAVDVVRRLGA